LTVYQLGLERALGRVLGEIVHEEIIKVVGEMNFEIGEKI